MRSQADTTELMAGTIARDVVEQIRWAVFNLCLDGRFVIHLWLHIFA